MTRYSDLALFSEAEVTLVDHKAGYQWDMDGEERHRPTEPSLMPPAVPVRADCDVPAEDAQKCSAQKVQNASRRYEPVRRAATVASPSLSSLGRPPAAASGRRGGNSNDAAFPAAETHSSLTADALRQQRSWKRGATDARRSLAERRDQREALSRVLAMAKPRALGTPAPVRTMSRSRAGTQNR
jgi:hypothetical protein